MQTIAAWLLLAGLVVTSSGCLSALCLQVCLACAPSESSGTATATASRPQPETETAVLAAPRAQRF